MYMQLLLGPGRCGVHKPVLLHLTQDLICFPSGPLARSVNGFSLKYPLSHLEYLERSHHKLVGISASSCLVLAGTGSCFPEASQLATRHISATPHWFDPLANLICPLAPQFLPQEFLTSQ